LPPARQSAKDVFADCWEWPTAEEIMVVGKDSFADRSLGRSAKSMFADCPVFGRWQRVLAIGKAEFSCSGGSETGVLMLLVLTYGP
jgi:hypothetical protein